MDAFAEALQWDAGLEPLAVVTRGGAPEFVYRGVAVCCDGRGRAQVALGNADSPIHLRSCAKPFQALALVETGAADELGFTDQELALACGSHAGQPEHVEVVWGLLARLGVAEEALVCGGAQHMCSGKHTAMIALAVHLGVPIEGYHQPHHPVQRVIADHLAAAAGLPSESLLDGTDGCGVPVIRMPIMAVARLYARLAAGDTPALARLRDAMIAHPDLVAGEGRPDTEIMREASGALVAKSGAGGVQALAWVGGTPSEAGACVVKLSGESTLPVALLVAASTAGRCASVAWASVDRLRRWAEVRNVRGEVVGEVVVPV